MTVLKQSFLLKYLFPEQPEYSVLVEQTNHVAYAYLLKQGSIISDVWLYNVSETPLTIDWDNRKNLPFKNPLSFLKDSNPVIPAANNQDIEINWRNQGYAIQATIYLRGELLAEINSNNTIGRSMLVKLSGPLANVLEL